MLARGSAYDGQIGFRGREKGGGETGIELAVGKGIEKKSERGGGEVAGEPFPSRSAPGRVRSRDLSASESGRVAHRYITCRDTVFSLVIINAQKFHLPVPLFALSSGVITENSALPCCVLFALDGRKGTPSIPVISERRVLKILIKPSGRALSSPLSSLRICHVCPFVPSFLPG